MLHVAERLAVALAVELEGQRARLTIDGQGTVTPARVTLTPGPVTLGLALESGGSVASARLESVVLRRH